MRKGTPCQGMAIPQGEVFSAAARAQAANSTDASTYMWHMEEGPWPGLTSGDLEGVEEGREASREGGQVALPRPNHGVASDHRWPCHGPRQGERHWQGIPGRG